MKTCKDCGVTKPLEDFYKRENSTDGCRAECKLCNQKRKKEILSDPQRRERERESHKKAGRKYAAKRRAELKDTPAYKEKKRLADLKYREKHRETLGAQKRQEYERNKARYRKSGAEYRRKNKSKIKAYLVAYETKLKGNGGFFTADDWDFLCALNDWRCYCCNRKLPLAADHIVPVSKGGPSFIENIQPLCKSCNSRKGKKTVNYKEKIIMESNKALGPDALDTWAIVELLGHVRLSGRVQEVQMFGGIVGRIDVPTKDGGFLTSYFGGGSIYRLTPVSEQVARDVAAKCSPEPISSYDYPAPVREAMQRARLPAVAQDGDERPRLRDEDEEENEWEDGEWKDER